MILGRLEGGRRTRRTSTTDNTPKIFILMPIERTICEKIMSLVRFSQMDHPYTNLSNKIRHVYDIHLMMNDESIQSFFKSSEFDKMLVKVGKTTLSVIKMIMPG